MPRSGITAVALAFLLAGCSATAAPSSTTTKPTTATTTTAVPPTSTTTTPPPEADPPLDHDAGTLAVGDLTADVYAPGERGPWPVVVTVHGGGWVTGSPAATAPLADALAARGIVAVNVPYRTVSLGGGFPTSVDDVACAVAAVRAAAPAYTTTPERIVLVGHSAGAHLAALVALAPGEFGGDCAAGARVDGFVGLSGPYDTDLLAPVLAVFFGVTIDDDPDLWARGNPITYAATAPDIPVLLLHGDADELVPVAFSRELADLLAGAGKPVAFETVPGGHNTTLDPAVTADRITEFVAALP